MHRLLFIGALLFGRAQESPRLPTAADEPLVRTVDLSLGESVDVALWDGRKAAVKLLDLQETLDNLRDGVRSSAVSVQVNGEKVTLGCGTYRLPVTVAGVRIDCPVTKGYNARSRTDPWGLVKDVRLRLWPEGSPVAAPGTFQYPLRQRWFASMTQMANEPTYVDGGEVPGSKDIYYHYGLDFGGAEGLADVVAATDGTVISSGLERLPGHDGTPVAPRYDVVYLQCPRGWYYRYSHLMFIEAAIRPGTKVRMGQKIGVLGKEGGSGGWSHLHFDINAKQPSGKWGIQEGYAFIWEAYQREHAPKILAVARPHAFVRTGDPVLLDGSRSWSAAGPIRSFEWTLSDGTVSVSDRPFTRTYDRPGTYSEILKVKDAEGRIDYDFMVVNVVPRDNPKDLPPTIHAVYAPTFGIRTPDPVTFKVRTFRTRDGEETWDFGDGTPPVRVKSDGNANQHDPNGYAVTMHKFGKPGHYVVRVERSNAQGVKATAHLQVRVGVE